MQKAEPPTAKAARETAIEVPVTEGKNKPRVAGRIEASPLAKRLAEEKGVDLALVKGTGPRRRITRDDDLDFLAGKPASEFEVLPMTSMRRAIAAKTTGSKTHVPHFYVSTEVDITKAAKMREEMLPKLEADAGVRRLSYAHLFVKAAALALKEYPKLNSTLDGKNIKLWRNVNIGIAVGLDDGLIVPVLRDASQLSLREISVRANKLVAKARAKRLREDESTGGTFTVSNMGALNVDSFTAAIDVPETAILASGRANGKDVVINDDIVVRKMMTATLPADHRIVDGVLAAKSLQRAKNNLETLSNLT